MPPYGGLSAATGFVVGAVVVGIFGGPIGWAFLACIAGESAVSSGLALLD